MSGSTTTVPGGVIPQNFSDASGSAQWFDTHFPPGGSYPAFTASGNYTGTGSVIVAGSGGVYTISGASAIDDANGAGTNAITTTSPAAIYAAPNDTITAASSASTIFGAGSGQTTFSLGGGNDSVIGGSGSIVGTVSGNNSTLVGGTGVSLFTITGANALAVAGPQGTTGIDLSQSTGPETIATDPLGNSGTLIATLGSGADTVVGGGGASTITAGSGADVFGFVNGHAGGSEVILGFNAKDNIAFEGYDYSASNTPLETVTASGDMMTLQDGTTILFAGLNHKLF